MIGELRPQVAVIEYALPRMSGVELCEDIVTGMPETAVVNDDIAEQLHVSENTVKTYLRRALEKLNCHNNRSEAAATAAKRGLL